MNVRSLKENQNLAQLQASCGHNLLKHENIQIQAPNGKPYTDEFYVCANCSAIISPIPSRIGGALDSINTSLANLNNSFRRLLDAIGKK